MVKRVPRRLKRGYCQRSGDRVRENLLMREPGTNLLVTKEFNDGIYNRSRYDPRDKPPKPNPNEGKPRWYAEPDPYPQMELDNGEFLANYDPANDSEFDR